MPLADQRFSELLAQIASKTPAPGGGAVASLAGSLASALGSMVVAYSLGKKDLAAHRTTLEAADEELRRAGVLLMELAQEDMDAYEALSRAQRLPAGDPGRDALAALTATATQIPLAIIAACTELLRLFEALVPIVNRHLISDLAIAATLGSATARASVWLVRVNAGSLPAGDAASAIAQARTMLDTGAAALARIEAACAARS